MKTRTISAILWSPVLIGFTYLGGIPFLLFSTFFAIVGQKEFYDAVGLGNDKAKKYMYVMTIVIYLSALLENNNIVISLVLLNFLIVFIYFMRNFETFPIEKAALYIFSIIYIPVTFLLIYKMRNMEHGLWIVCLPFIMAFSSDTFAYFTGKFLGKTKLAPVLSPNKTVEGAIGGIIGSVIMVYIFMQFMCIYALGHDLSVRITIIILIASAIGAVLSQFGDLCASAIKRQKNFKDYGDLIKGHGGVLDRTDSVIFTTQFLFIILSII